MNLAIYRPDSDDVGMEDPSAEDIQRAISDMGDEECVVLAHDDNTFMQAVASRDEGLVLEHQAGSTDDFFVSRNDIAMDDALRCMLSYHAGDDAWRQNVEWEQVNLLAYLNADFTMLTYVAAEALEQGGVVDFEEFYEMPCIGMHHLIMLYQLLCEAEYEDLEEQFDLLGEADMDDNHHALMYLVPIDFFLALEQLDPEAIPPLAAKWRETEYFPETVATVEDVADLLKEITDLARNCAAKSSLLVVCEVESGDEEGDEDIDELPTA